VLSGPPPRYGSLRKVRKNGVTCFRARSRVRHLRGDVLTTTGSDRSESGVESPAPPGPPRGGVGGSVLQTLGSDGRKARREKRRAEKKQLYAEYLKSSTWHRFRLKVLERELGRCQACAAQATVVHHIRYPKILGEERLEWLYALCARCHDEIHRRARKKGVSLRRATWQVLDLPPPPPRPKRRKRGKRNRIASPPLTKGKLKLIDENDRLHELQVRNRQKRGT